MEGHSSFGIVLRKDDKSGKKSKKLSKPHPHEEEFNATDLPPVHRAAAQGNVDTLSELIKRDCELVEQYSLDGLTPLAQAVLCQQLDSVKRLINLGANIDAQDNVGRTCLSIAAYQGWHQGVMCLLRSGAKQSICDKSGRYPLHAATYHSDMRCWQPVSLIGHRHASDFFQLSGIRSIVCKVGLQRSCTLSLLLNGLTEKEINQTDHELMTAVHWAAFHDRPEHLLILVQKGGDILARDVDGKLPLHWAAQNNSFQCVHRLTSLSEGLKTVNDVDFSGKSPAHYAAAAGAANILKILHGCEGCNLEIEDPDERTPLHWAAAMGQAKAVEMLLSLGVSPFPMDVDGGTPLEYALQGGNQDVIKVMEDCIGASEVKFRVDSKMDSAVRDQRTEHRYHYNKASTSKDEATVLVPEIEVQPPTTLTKSTSNRTVKTVPDMVPRMFSASSTDTDAYDFQGTEPVTTRDVTADAHPMITIEPTPKQNPTTSKGGSTDIKDSSAIATLVGASYSAGAQAPILIHSPKLNRTMQSFREDGESQAPESRDGAGNKWAIPSKEGPNSASADPLRSAPKVKTSQNTPELQRVSVQSFRSIPPIPANPENSTSPREPGRQVRTTEASLGSE